MPLEGDGALSVEMHLVVLLLVRVKEVVRVASASPDSDVVDAERKLQLHLQGTEEGQITLCQAYNPVPLTGVGVCVEEVRQPAAQPVIVPGRRGMVGEGCYLSGWWDDGYGVLGGGVGSVVCRGGSTNPLLLSGTVAVIVVRSYQ